MSTSFSAMLPMFGVAALLLGLGLLKRGRWPRRVGQTAHCPKCDYILVGDPPRCSECGTLIDSGTTVHGERKRKPILVFLGAWFAVFGLAMLILVGTASIRSVDWNRHKPLGWLLHDLRSSNPSTSTTAWNEIRRRLDGHQLSDSDQAEVVEVVEQAQGSTLPCPIDDAVTAYIGSRFLDGKLTAAQADRFFAGLMTVKLWVRPLVGCDSRLPYMFTVPNRSVDDWWLYVREIEAQVDRGPTETLSAGTESSLNRGSWGFGGSLSPVRSPGPHRVRFEVEMTIGASRDGSWKWDVAGARRVRQNLFADFQAAEGQTPVQAVTKPDAAVLRSHLLVMLAPSVSEPNDCEVIVEANRLPMDLAFDVFVRFNGKEYPAGSMSFYPGARSRETTVRNLPSERPDEAEVIFRSSKAVALRDMPDITRLWQGAIVFPNVPLPRPPAARIAPRPSIMGR